MPFVIRSTISQTFLDRVRATPQKIGFTYKIQNEWKKITFRTHYDDAKQIACGLMNLGILPSDKVAILCTTRYEWSLCDISIIGSRAVTIPIYPSNTAEDVAYILNHSEAKIVFVEDAKQLQKILNFRKAHPLPHLQKIIAINPAALAITLDDPSQSKDVLTLQALREIGKREDARDPARFDQNLSHAKPSDLVTICYTSGTTGVPKGAMITHDNVMSVIEDCASFVKDFANTVDEAILSFLPFSHILGKIESLTVYAYGWKNGFAESHDLLMTNLQEVKPTVLFVVPRVFEKAHARVQDAQKTAPKFQQIIFQTALACGRRYFEAIWKGKRPTVLDTAEYLVAKKLVFSKITDRLGGRLKLVVCGGAPLSVEIGEFFQIAGIQICEGYGLTETTAPVTFNTPKAFRFGTVGKPLPEVNIKIADDGEILIKSRKVFIGYYKDEAETAQVLEGEWFHTGDVGMFDSDGFLKITDRKKDLIVTSGGKNIAPQKIESLAKHFPLINHLVVHGDRRNFLTALVTLDREAVIKYASLNQILFSAYAELVKHPKIISLVQQAIDSVNQGLAHFESIKKFVIIPNEFSIESGELTPSMKIKRKVIAQHYENELNHLYAEPSP